MRTVLELVLTIIAVVVARAILTSLMRGVANAGRTAAAPPPSENSGFQTQGQSQSNGARGTQQQAQPTGELHKDPVCGTYVAESTPFRRQASGQTFYYCSADCREKHTLVASK
jgi:YHS domain-containing protein